MLSRVIDFPPYFIEIETSYVKIYHAPLPTNYKQEPADAAIDRARNFCVRRC